MVIPPSFLRFSNRIFDTIKDRFEDDQEEPIRWEWIQFHRVNMLFYQQSKANPKKYDFHKKLEHFALRQSVQNTLYLREWTHLATLFEQHNIPILPYKGLVWQHEWYGNKPWRDMTDLDVWVSPSHVVPALQLLQQLGYTSTNLPSFHAEMIEEVLRLAPNPEVSLKKEYHSSLRISLDFHWEIQAQHGPKLPFQDVWEMAKPWVLGGRSPSMKHQFQLLLIHHGTKDTWKQLKTLIDLYHFLIGCKETEETLHQWASELSRAETFLQGRFLLFLLGWLPEPIQPPQNLANVRRIISFWQTPSSWKSTKYKWKHHVMMRNSYAPPLSWWQVWNDFLDYHGHYSHLDTDRLIKFPQHWRLLNVISKYGTFLLRK